MEYVSYRGEGKIFTNVDPSCKRNSLTTTSATGDLSFSSSFHYPRLLLMFLTEKNIMSNVENNVVVGKGSS